MTVTIIVEDTLGTSTITAVDVTMIDDYLEVTHRALLAAGFVLPTGTRVGLVDD